MQTLPFGQATFQTVETSSGRILSACGPLKNLFLYEGADILGRLTAGQSSYAPNMAYIEFQNGGVPPTIIPLRDEGRSYYAKLETSGPPVNRDYLRIPLIFNAAVAAGADDYSSNKVTFSVMSQGDAGVSGLEFSATAQSKIYGAALVAAPNTDDRTTDLVFARVYLTTPLTKGPTEQVHIYWPYEFE